MAEPVPEQPDELASPGGNVYPLKKGTGKFGYEGVYAPHGPEKGFHVKLRLNENSKEQTTIPGPACKTAKEAALRGAMFRAAPFEITKKDPERAPRRESWQSVLKRSLEDETPEDPEDMPAWVVSRDALEMWKAGMEPPASVQLSAAAAAEVWRLRAWATGARLKAPRMAVATPAPVVRKQPRVAAKTAVRAPTDSGSGSQFSQRVQLVHEVQAGPPPVFDPAVLARVADIKSRAGGV